MISTSIFRLEGQLNTRNVIFESSFGILTSESCCINVPTQWVSHLNENVTLDSLSDTVITDLMAISILLACKMGDFCIPLVYFMDWGHATHSLNMYLPFLTFKLANWLFYAIKFIKNLTLLQIVGQNCHVINVWAINAVIHIWDYYRSHLKHKDVMFESYVKLSSQTILLTRYKTTKSHDLEISNVIFVSSGAI